MRYLEDVPADSEIRQAMEELFRSVQESKSAELLSALILVDTTMELGCRVLNYVSDYEMEELCWLVNDFRSLSHADTNTDNKTRIKVLVYCHIFEADFPLTVCWNLLRTLAGQQCSWTFSRETKSGKKELCKYPQQRIQEIERLSKQTGMGLGNMLGRVWRNDLRNSFSHSQYFLEPNALICSRTLSPVSRPDVGVGNQSRSYTFDDIDDLYGRALEFLDSFIEQYKGAIRPYKNGQVYATQARSVRWDAGQCRWTWADARGATEPL